jgi:hypothetical protein
MDDFSKKKSFECPNKNFDFVKCPEKRNKNHVMAKRTEQCVRTEDELARWLQEQLDLLTGDTNEELYKKLAENKIVKDHMDKFLAKKFGRK